MAIKAEARKNFVIESSRETKEWDTHKTTGKEQALPIYYIHTLYSPRSKHSLYTIDI
jgi:hypothetical protein